MDIDDLRRYCLSFPHATESVQWGDNLCFKVDGKLFCVTALEAAPVRLSFKCSHEDFAALCEREGIVPAPYMARAQWVALEQLNTLPDAELRESLAESYRLVWERIPQKRRAELEKSPKDAKLAKSAKKVAAKAAKKKPTATKARPAKLAKKR